MNVLLAVTGLSPAIVTETVWALARGKPRIIPGRVEFITTAVGAHRIREQLFTPAEFLGGRTVWECLRESLGAEGDQLIAAAPHVISRPDPRSGTERPLEDIASGEDNAAAADFILSRVRTIVENPDETLIASIAGGRKTMGALLYAALSLIGRETDRLTHVLVSEPYETLPGFFFPGQPGGFLRGRDGAGHDPAKARVHLAEVPFVPLRNRFEDLGTKPGSFANLVASFGRELKADALRPVRVRFDLCGKVLEVDGKPVPRVRAGLQIALRFLVEAGPFDSVKTASDASVKWFAAHPERDDFLLFWTERNEVRQPCMDTRTIDRCKSELKTKLLRAGCRWPVHERTLDFSRFEIVV